MQPERVALLLRSIYPFHQLLDERATRSVLDPSKRRKPDLVRLCTMFVNIAIHQFDVRVI